MGAPATLTAEAQACLAAGDWAAAERAFARLVAEDPQPEALLGLGSARWWLGQTRAGTECYERAYAGLRRRGDAAGAAVAAVQLSLLAMANTGNRSVAAGWAGRAGRLAEQTQNPVIAAWAELARAALVTDPEEAMAICARAHRVGEGAGDRDLELCAISLRGAALVDAGRVAEGAALLDEALAGALGGEVEQLETVVFTSCELMRACVRCADFGRVVEWLRALEGFTARYGAPYIRATCRTQYGAALVATGDWPRAEAELAAAIAISSDALPGVRAAAVGALAELRLAQGRVEEAARLLVGHEDQTPAAPARIALLLARGEATRALAIARRALAAAGGRRLEAARLAELLGEALIATGDAAAARAEGRGLVSLGAREATELVSARGARLSGRALLAGGDDAAARAALEAALGGFARLEMPLEGARTRAALAEALHAEAPAVAEAELEAALAAFAALGAAPDADAAAARLRSWGAPVARARAGPGGPEALTRREREVLDAVAEGLSNPEIATRLYISRRTVEHHVASVLSKLRLRNRAEAAAYAARHMGAGGDGAVG